MKSGVLSRRKFGVALARCDGALSQEDKIIVWIQMAAFGQQGRLQKVNVSLHWHTDCTLKALTLVFWGSMKKFLFFSIPRHTCTNHQLRKSISVVIKCLQTLFYDVQYYFACITANMEKFSVKIHRHSKMFAHYIHVFPLIHFIYRVA